VSVSSVIIPVTIEPLEDGWYLAACDGIQGCHAEGETVEEALENIEDVARMIWELCCEENLLVPGLLAPYKLGTAIKAQIIEVDKVSEP